MRSTFTLESMSRWDPAKHTEEDLQRALSDLFQNTYSDLLATLRKGANLTRKHPAFVGMAGDRMYDAKVPDAIVKKMQTWLRKNP